MDKKNYRKPVIKYSTIALGSLLSGSNGIKRTNESADIESEVLSKDFIDWECEDESE